MTIWMRVSSDEYQLPEIIAESRKELAYLCGVSEQAIAQNRYYAKRGNGRERYVKVKLEDE